VVIGEEAFFCQIVIKEINKTLNFNRFREESSICKRAIKDSFLIIQQLDVISEGN
jgi:16S rRNA G527 N7-methylase RsmG